MKKHLFCFFGGSKIWRIPLTMSLLLLVPSAPGFAEEHIKEISVNLADVSLKEAIQQIEKVSGYSFFYDENKIGLTKLFLPNILVLGLKHPQGCQCHRKFSF